MLAHTQLYYKKSTIVEFIYLITSSDSSRNKVLARVKSFFVEADTDNSGALTLTEMTIALRKQGYSGNEDDIKVNHLWRAHKKVHNGLLVAAMWISSLNLKFNENLNIQWIKII